MNHAQTQWWRPESATRGVAVRGWPAGRLLGAPEHGRSLLGHHGIHRHPSFFSASLFPRLGVDPAGDDTRRHRYRCVCAGPGRFSYAVLHSSTRGVGGWRVAAWATVTIPFVYLARRQCEFLVGYFFFENPRHVLVAESFGSHSGPLRKTTWCLSIMAVGWDSSRSTTTSRGSLSSVSVWSATRGR